MNRYDIWIGFYHLGQGHHGSIEPKLLDTIEAFDFKTACLKHELLSKLRRIREGESKKNLNDQDYPWWFNEHTITNSWTGKYYETREEALKSFK